MKRISVSSSRISSIGWENNILEVEFKNGTIYHYYNVTIQEYEEFKNSYSLGSSLSKLEKLHRYSKVY